MRGEIRAHWGKLRDKLLRSDLRGLRRTPHRLAKHLADLPAGRRQLLTLIVALGTVALLTAVAVVTTTASEENVLQNGSFEGGFQGISGCGDVGQGWGCFTNGGAANYGFYDDKWDQVVADGKHSQLIEINTKDIVAGDADRYAGIYQTVRVSPRGTYRLSLRGIIRTTHLDSPDPWRYRVQVGWVKGPNTDWRHVDNWTDVGWNTYYEREKPGSLSDFQTLLMPEAEVITLFIRVWKKWGVAYEEIDVNLDAISLVGPPPQRGPDKPGGPQGHGPQEPGPHTGIGGPVAHAGPSYPDKHEPDHRDYDGPVSCGGPDLLYNGSFEHGFNSIQYGDVGRGWGAFTNGGAANYGFYDEEWTPVISDGKHGQLIEINTKGIVAGDHDRYAGIFQRIDGLKPGGVYELSLRGLLRGEGNEDDPYRFEAQWGLNEGADHDWRHVHKWVGMDLGPIYPRTEPVSMGTYTVRFVAPAQTVTLFIRGWKKFGVSNVEMDFNLDAIRLTSCTTGGTGGPDHGPDKPGGPGPKPGGPDTCVYVVKSGDSLSQIAAQHRISLDDLVRANGIDNPNIIYVGQKLTIPGCSQDGPHDDGPREPSYRPEPEKGKPEPQREPERRDPEHRDPEGHGPRPQTGGPDMRPSKGDEKGSGERFYVVKSGDYLGRIAEDYGVNVYELARINGIDNINLLYVGQRLVIP